MCDNTLNLQIYSQRYATKKLINTIRMRQLFRQFLLFLIETTTIATAVLKDLAILYFKNCEATSNYGHLIKKN